MVVSVRGHSVPHFHFPCTRCGYATRYKQWPTTCACSGVQAQSATVPAVHVLEIWAEQEANNAELRKIDYSHIPPLRISARYAAEMRRKVTR